MNYRPAPIYIVFIFTILLDQLTKWAIMNSLTPTIDQSLWTWFTMPILPSPYAIIEITSFLNFVMVWNTGISFGLFANGTMMSAYLLAGIAILAAIIFMIWGKKTSTPPIITIAAALIAGGALGNAIDRLRFGAVIDFLDVYVESWHWPAFNIADSAIVIGVAIVVLHSLLFGHKDNEGDL